MDAFAMMRERLVTEAEKSSTAYCDSVMSLGELTVRHATAVAVALLPMTGEYQPDRYRFEHSLLRSSGIGDWATAFQRITVGPLHPVVAENAACGGRGGALTQLTEKVKPGDWRHEVVEALHECLRFVGEQVDTPRSPQMLRFFVDFPRLRNKLDAHGAPTSGTKEEISTFLAPAIEQLVSNLLILNMPLFGVTSSPPDGRPTVVTASTSGDEAGRETVRTYLASMKFRDGLYLGCGSFVSPVVLTHVDSDSRDYFYANGAYRSADSCAEYLSFATGSRRRVRVNEWTKPPDRTRPSVTAGQGALAERGRGFSNAPRLAEGYVARPAIEVQLQEALRNPKRFVAPR